VSKSIHGFLKENDGLERYVIPNLRNASRVLKLLGETPKGLKASEIARGLDLPVSTTLRIMATLQLEGFVRKTDWRYELGPILIHLGNAALSGTEIRALAGPVLQELTASTAETSHLAIPCGNRSLIAVVQDSPHPLRAASMPGFLADLHCSSTGKVFLAFRERTPLADLVRSEKPARRTPKTLVGVAELKRELEAVRTKGYAVDNEEYFKGVRCLAAPVYGSDGEVVAAVGITAATLRFPLEDVDDMAKHVLAAATRLSSGLGRQ